MGILWKDRSSFGTDLVLESPSIICDFLHDHATGSLESLFQSQSLYHSFPLPLDKKNKCLINQINMAHRSIACVRMAGSLHGFLDVG